MKRDYDKIVTWSLILLVIPFTILSAIRFFSNPYDTMIAYSHYESKDYDLKGVVIRDEIVINDVVGENRYYNFDEGDLVSVSQDILEVYSSAEEVQSLIAVEAYSNEIEALKTAASVQNIYYTGEMLDDQLSNEVAMLNSETMAGDVSNIEDHKREIVETINMSMIATGQEDGYGKRLSSLSASMSQLRSQIGAPIQTVTAPITGYLSTVSDGYESAYSLESLLSSEASSIYDFIDNGENNQFSEVTAKLITDHNWYVAVNLDNDIVEDFGVGDTVVMNFGGEYEDDIDGKIISIKSEDNKHVAIIKSFVISDEILRLRFVDVSIDFGGYSGLLLEKEALRYNEENQAGVYIIEGGVIKFRYVDVIYDTDSYIICRENLQEPNSLSMFDEVIVGGKDVYDQKVIDNY